MKHLNLLLPVILALPIVQTIQASYLPSKSIPQRNISTLFNSQLYLDDQKENSPSPSLQSLDNVPLNPYQPHEANLERDSHPVSLDDSARLSEEDTDSNLSGEDDSEEEEEEEYSTGSSDGNPFLQLESLTSGLTKIPFLTTEQKKIVAAQLCLLPPEKTASILTSLQKLYPVKNKKLLLEIWNYFILTGSFYSNILAEQPVKNWISHSLELDLFQEVLIQKDGVTLKICQERLQVLKTKSPHIPHYVELLHILKNYQQTHKPTPAQLADLLKFLQPHPPNLQLLNSKKNLYAYLVRYTITAKLYYKTCFSYEEERLLCTQLREIACMPENRWGFSS